MSQVTPFLQNGNTTKITAAVTAPSGVNILPTFVAVLPPYNQYRVVNPSTSLVFIGVAPTAAQAATAAAAVTTTGQGIPIVPGAVEVFSFPPEWFFSATTASGTADIYITPGEGL